MKSRRALGIAIATAIAVVLVVLLWHVQADDPSSATKEPRDEGPRQPSPTTRPALSGRPDPQTPAPQTGGSAFERIRREALARFDGDVTTRVQMCVTTEGGAAGPPQPRDVRLVFEWKPELSTPELQTLVVKEISIVDVGGLSTPSRDCIRRATGMQLRLPIAASELPLDARTFDQIVKLPVP